MEIMVGNPSVLRRGPVLGSRFICMVAMLICGSGSVCTFAIAQTRQATIDVQWNAGVQTGGVGTFDRNKFITMHSSLSDQDWIGEQDKLRYLMEDLDVSFGRDTGKISWTLSQLKQDAGHKGYLDFSFMERFAEKARSKFASRIDLRPYADREDLILCGQFHRFWPQYSVIHPADRSPDWTPVSADSVGQYAAYWVNLFTGGDGPKRPQLMEIVNEPLYEAKQAGQEHGAGHPIASVTPHDVFMYHRDVANSVRRFNTEIKIGGYTAAFPDLEKDDFDQWRQTWKDFIDTASDQMDFYSLHLYDFPGIQGGKQFYRKGCHMEATLDMIEHYSAIRHGQPKPFVISEYGSQLHDWYRQPWSSERDWMCLKAMNSMMIQLCDRPDRVLKAIPFVTGKAEWGFDEGGSGQPYYWRLMRRSNEPADYSGDYVFTDLIKFYELWSEVRGRRVLSQSTDSSLLVDAYVNDHDGFLIVNNLRPTPVRLNLRQRGAADNPIQNAFGKHLYFDQQSSKPAASRLDVVDLMQNVSPLVLGPEATMVLRFRRSGPVAIERTVDVKTYYAKQHLQTIDPDQSAVYDVTIPSVKQSGRVTLRIGVGRSGKESPIPEVEFNSVPLSVPADFRGPEQTDRAGFFGVIEVSVPPDLLANENRVVVRFASKTGHVSSVVVRHALLKP